MLRLFAALAIPPEIGQPLMRRQTGLDGARWRPLDAFHITLRFYGDVREDVAADLDAELETVAAGPLTLALQGVGSFGEGYDIHAVWAGVEENPPLNRLAQATEKAARKAGMKPESRKYLPHVTLAYLRRSEPADVAAWIQQNNLLKSPEFTLDRFGLYSSWRTDEGSRYVLEREYRL